MNDDSSFYDSHKQKTVVALIAKADEYLHEAFCRYSEYKKSESSYLRIHKKAEEQIAALNTERQKLSFWRFSRREDIDAEILHLQKKEEEAKQAMRKARKHFELMYRNSVIQNERTIDNMTSIRCINCGSLIAGNHSQCPNCGWKLAE